MKNKKTKPLIFLLVVLYLICSVKIFITVVNVISPSLFEGMDTIRKTNELKSLISKYYYKDTDDEALSIGAFRGMVESLNDPYSEFYTPEEYNALMEKTSGKFSGIGAVLSQDPDTKEVSITSVYDGSPAQKGGLLPGDILISADEYLSSELEFSVFVSHIKGKEGTSVDITYIREGKENTVTLIREEIITPSVSYEMLDENTGLITIFEFSDNTKEEFMNAVSELETEGMTDVVYDIRSNPGGLVKSVTDILDEILPEGVTVYMMDKNGNRTDYTSDDEHQMEYPCVVLINENSASSSEIFAGAIKDFKYGTLVGTTTFGKGIVQNIFKLSDGSGLKVTVSEYFTPSGVNIHGIGIEPDIQLEFEYQGKEGEPYNMEYDNQIQKALEILNK